MKNFKLLFSGIALLVISGFILEVKVEGLKIGQEAPAFEGKDQKGKIFKLSEALAKGSVVIFFYRGEWCPHCNRFISNIQDSIDLIYKKGALVVGVSPEKPEGIEKTIDKTYAKFSLIHDADNVIGIAYDTYDPSTRLPVPATYIIGKDGKIKFAHFNKRYQYRASVKEILGAL